MAQRFTRRSLLRGVIGGTAVSVGLPALDMFINDNGDAWADGGRFAMRFGTYFWGLGLTDTPAGGTRWVPKTVGKGFEITPELQSLAAVRDKVSVFSGFRVIGDGRPNVVHWSGHASILSGLAPAKTGVLDGPSFDTRIADALGTSTRFRALDLSASGDVSANYSSRTGTSFATPETTPIALYTRLFGEDFRDPNDPNWAPNPDMLLRRSVLAAIGDQRKALMAEAGHSDQIKLDQYFTSLRDIENQLTLQLQRPEKCEACVVPARPEETPRGLTVDVVERNCTLMARLLAMGLACDQTRVFNMVHTPGFSTTYIRGETKTYHQTTHDEPTDAKLGYQPRTSELAGMVMRSFGAFLTELDAVKEGDGTLLDHSLVMGFSDTGYAKIHSLENIPVFFAGRANGRHNSGIHVVGKGEAVTRLSLTAQQIVGLPVGEFGGGAMKTSRPITEVMA